MQAGGVLSLWIGAICPLACITSSKKASSPLKAVQTNGKASGESFGPQGHNTDQRSEARGSVAGEPGCHAAHIAASTRVRSRPRSSKHNGPKGQRSSACTSQPAFADTVGTSLRKGSSPPARQPGHRLRFHPQRNRTSGWVGDPSGTWWFGGAKNRRRPPAGLARRNAGVGGRPAARRNPRAGLLEEIPCRRTGHARATGEGILAKIGRPSKRYEQLLVAGATPGEPRGRHCYQYANRAPRGHGAGKFNRRARGVRRTFAARKSRFTDPAAGF